MADALTPEEEVAAVHTHIKLAADPAVWYDNPVTQCRELWEHGRLTSSHARVLINATTWRTAPNPWIVTRSSTGEVILPY